MVEVNDNEVKSFNMICLECKSESCSVEYEFIYWGEYTGWENNLTLSCNDCGNSYQVSL